MEDLTVLRSNETLMNEVRKVRKANNLKHAYCDFIDAYNNLTESGIKFNSEISEKINELENFVNGSTDYYEEVTTTVRRYKLNRKLTDEEISDLENGNYEIWDLDCYNEHTFEELECTTENKEIVVFDKEIGGFITKCNF